MREKINIMSGLLFLLALFSSDVQAEVISGDFSADVVTASDQGEIAMKLYSSGQKSRMEMPESLMIVRQDLGVMWMVMPSQSLYMEQPIDLSMAVRTSGAMPGEIERVSQGSERVNGKTAEKFKITYEAAGRRDSVYQWIAEGLIPVRTQALDGSWTVDFKNVSTGQQPASLFEVPPGFKKFAVPSMGDLMKSVGGSLDQGQ